jgi:peroxiredoxin
MLTSTRYLKFILAIAAAAQTGIGFDVDDPVPAIQSFAAELGMNYPVLVGADRDDVKDAYGPPVGYPTSFIIDREGRICASHTGFVPKETFEQEILALL